MEDNKNIPLPAGGIAHQEIHFHGTVEQVNTAATTVTNTYNYYGKEAKLQGEDTIVDKAALKKKILEDVEKLEGMVCKSRRPMFMDLWKDILELKEVKYDIYNPGRNKDRGYSRKLVAGIIRFIGSDFKNCLGWFDKYNASEIARVILDSDAKSIRGELGDPLPEDVRNAIRKLVNEKYS